MGSDDKEHTASRWRGSYDGPSQSVYPLEVRKRVRTPVSFGRSALGKDTLDDIASKDFLKSARDQVVLFLYFFFGCHPGSRDVVVRVKDVYLK